MTEMMKNNLDAGGKGDVKSGDFTQDITTESGAFAIVDASILNSTDSPLANKAVVVPTKHDGIFTISGKYSDGIITSLTITPKKDQHGDVVDKVESVGSGGVPKPGQVVKVQEGLIPAHSSAKASHDDRIGRRMREAGGSKPMRDHMAGKKRHKPDPIRHASPKMERGTMEKHTEKKRLKGAGMVGEMKEIYDFVNNTVKNNDVTVEDIEKVKNKELLGRTINKMYSMCLSGWVLEEGILKNTETGIEANASAWSVKDGLLVDASGNNPGVDFDWAYKAREAYREYNRVRSVNMVEDFINHGREIIG